MLSAVAATVGTACASAPGSGTVLAGTVLLSPDRPVCRVGQSCSSPIAGFKLVFSSSAVVARATTDRHGRYRLRLRPGTYRVTTPARRRVGRGLAPTRVKIRSVRRQSLNFTYDSGIR